MKIFNAVIIILMILKIKPIKSYGRKLTSDQNNVYYIDSEQKYSWFEALIACIEMDMTLATIDSSTKSYEINTLVRNNFGNVRLWIGGIMSRYPNRHFIWLATGKPFTYTNWQGNNPDFYGNNEYCAHIGWINDLQWNDIVCTNKQGFICEYSQKDQQSKQMQQELQIATAKQQELQQQLEKNKQELQTHMHKKQQQEEKLQQELESVKEISKQENHKNQEIQQNLKQEVKECEEKLKESAVKYEQLEEILKGTTTELHELQQDLKIQQNLKDLLQEELEKLKKKDREVSSSDMNKKYRDIILHFHQYQ
ncbi:lectin subunit alpha-like [Lucilia cuprina]|uniref:lectin subunit alpha-like n=1 Tax=Lucilia cuprina TaxID=7375 RepID=UPI001F066050|nr:lectin subunit alpha-like [Lucilia cuprina]